MRSPLQSVVLVPALGAGTLVQELRLRYDPSAIAGVPPHITLMFPFLPAPDLTEENIDALEGLITAANRFEYQLARVCEFEQGVVYLDPQPAEPFVKLTRDIGRHFGLQPFGGEFGDTPVPHLTVAIPQPLATRRQVTAQLAPLLPVHLVAEEAWLMVGTNFDTWKVVRQMRLMP
jgi:2'-5' RNA ligase